jgi:stress response protein SCP2
VRAIDEQILIDLDTVARDIERIVIVVSIDRQSTPWNSANP